MRFRPSARGRRLWLTPALRRQAERLREEWLERALDTSPADRPAAEEAIAELYRMAGQETPRFVWVDSPVGALLVEWLLSGGRRGFDDDLLRMPYEKVLADPMWDMVGHEPRDSAWAAIQRGLGDLIDPTGLRRSLLTWTPGPAAGADLLSGVLYRPYLPYEVRAYRNRLRMYGAKRALADLEDRRTLASPPARLSDAADGWLTRSLPFPGPTWGLLGGALKEALSIPLGDWLGPPRRGLWLALSLHLLDSTGTMCDLYYKQADFTRICTDLLYRELGIVPGLRPEQSRRLDLMAAVARASGPWWPYPGVCIVIERPISLEADRPLQLPHRMDGPAMAWRDGFGIHAWQGVSVPARYTVGPLTAADWAAEPNLERKRVLAERIGYARLLDESHAERVATDDFGTLWRIPTPDGQEDLMVVDVLNSTAEPDGTRRRYVLRVPPGQRVPRDAIGWTFGLPPGTYNPTEMT